MQNAYFDKSFEEKKVALTINETNKGFIIIF